MSYARRVRHTRQFARGPGFTFLEVLIALCILLIALVPLIQLHVTSIRLIDSSSRAARATLLANAKLAEITATETPELGRANGRIEESRGLTFHWRSTVEKADPPELATAALLGIRHIHVEMSWREGSQDATVSADTFVRIPVQKKPEETNGRNELDSGKTITSRSRL